MKLSETPEFKILSEFSQKQIKRCYVKQEDGKSVFDCRKINELGYRHITAFLECFDFVRVIK